MHKFPNFLIHNKIVFFLFDVRLQPVLRIKEPLVIDGRDGGNVMVFEKACVLLRPFFVDQVDDWALWEILFHKLGLEHFPMLRDGIPFRQIFFSQYFNSSSNLSVYIFIFGWRRLASEVGDCGERNTRFIILAVFEPGAFLCYSYCGFSDSSVFEGETTTVFLGSGETYIFLSLYHTIWCLISTGEAGKERLHCSGDQIIIFWKIMYFTINWNFLLPKVHRK